jgi:hypothetical protein
MLTAAVAPISVEAIGISLLANVSEIGLILGVTRVVVAETEVAAVVIATVAAIVAMLLVVAAAVEGICHKRMRKSIRYSKKCG